MTGGMPPEPPVAAPEAPPVGAAPPAPPAPPVTEPLVPPVPIPPVPPVPHDVAHEPLHSIVPAAQAQTPPLQVWPSAQGALHMPQLRGSVARLVHAVPQVIRLHVALHVPAAQNCADGGQTLPHWPQL
jgi:hypothetical protein